MKANSDPYGTSERNTGQAGEYKNQWLTRSLGEPAADFFISLTVGARLQKAYLITDGKYAWYPLLTCVTTEKLPVTLIPSAHDTR